MTVEEAYQILGLEGHADARAVKLAYRRRALEWHPDRFSSPADKELYAERFRRARQAYEALRDGRYPELQAEPVPEPDFGPRTAGRSFATGDVEPAPQLEKLGFKFSWSMDSLMLWGLVMPAAAAALVYLARLFLRQINP